MPSDDPKQDKTPQPPPKRSTGVYQVDRATGPGDGDLYLPPAFSGEFWSFLSAFIRAPDQNPVFLREWRRTSRRWQRFRPLWSGLLVVGGMVSALAGIFLIVLLRDVLRLPGHLMELSVTASFFLPAVPASVLGLFLGLRGCRLLWNRQTIQELHVTLLKPQEIVFGHLAGAVIPTLIGFVFLLPGLALLVADLCLRQHRSLTILGPELLPGYLLFFLPFLAGSLVASAALTESLTYGKGDAWEVFGRPITIWGLVGFAINGLVILPFFWHWQAGDSLLPLFYLGIPVATLLKWALAGGFLHHAAVRLAQHPGDW